MEKVRDGVTAESLSATLEGEHREIDACIESFTDASTPGSRDRQALVSAVTTLRHHIYAEEELMFPPLNDAGLAGPIFVMLREHAQMWGVLDTLDGLLAADHPDEMALDGACTELLGQLQRHNPKEETILYPQVDGVLTAAAADRLRTFLTAGHVPDGWVCQQLRP